MKLEEGAETNNLNNGGSKMEERELVINACFGGFGLSIEAESLFAKKKGFEIFHYKQEEYEHRDGKDKYVKVGCDHSGSLCTHAIKKDLGESFSEFPEDDDDYWASRDIERDDPDLIEVVRELGVSASGDCGKLEIVKIPSDVEWVIDEYDGLESVSEKHRTWRA